MVLHISFEGQTRSRTNIVKKRPNEENYSYGGHYILLVALTRVVISSLITVPSVVSQY